MVEEDKVPQRLTQAYRELGAEEPPRAPRRGDPSPRRGSRRAPGRSAGGAAVARGGAGAVGHRDAAHAVRAARPGGPGAGGRQTVGADGQSPPLQRRRSLPAETEVRSSLCPARPPANGPRAREGGNQAGGNQADEPRALPISSASWQEPRPLRRRRSGTSRASGPRRCSGRFLPAPTRCAAWSPRGWQHGAGQTEERTARDSQARVARAPGRRRAGAGEAGRGGRQASGRTPERELERIAQLRRDEARYERTGRSRIRKRRPDYRIPEAMLERVERR